jgi:hypothetical protein
MITTFSVAACWAVRGGIIGRGHEFSWTQDYSTSRVGKAAGLMATASLPHPRRDRGAPHIAAEAAAPLGAAEDDRSGNADLLSAPAPEERFEVARRGYDRRQVEKFVDRSRRDAASLRNRLSQALREAEQLRVDLAAARRAAWEAAAQRERAERELAALRTEAQMALARNLRWPLLRQDVEEQAAASMPLPGMTA